MEEAVDNNLEMHLFHNIPNSNSRVERTIVVANLILSQIHDAIKIDLKALSRLMLLIWSTVLAFLGSLI